MKNSIIKNALYYFLLAIAFISATLFLRSIFLIDAKTNSLYFQAIITRPLVAEKEISTLVFVGDIMLNRGVEWMVKKEGNNDWRFPFLKIADEIKKADILFGNLEGPISDKGQKVGSIYSFRMDPKSIDGLLFAGFDILSVANNHMFDYSRVAMEDTFSRLKKAEIDYIGGGFNEIEAYTPKIKEINGTKIAFLAFTNLGSPYWETKEKRSGIAWLEKEKLEKSIKDAKKKSDIIIVSMHFGDEYKTSPTPEQKELARLAVDSGADLVVGHHPHIVQQLEKYTSGDISRESSKYKQGYIAYSLGNFIFDQNFSEETMEGLMLKVLVKDKKIQEVIPINFKINDFFQPEI